MVYDCLIDAELRRLVSGVSVVARDIPSPWSGASRSFSGGMLASQHRLPVRLGTAFPGALGTDPGRMQHPLVVKLRRSAMLAGRDLMIARGLLVLAARGMDGV
jgi:hypothetical protein